MPMAPTTASHTYGRRRALVPAGSQAHRVARLAAGLRAAAQDAGVTLTPSYAQQLAAEGAGRCDQLGVTKLGEGVVIHTAPDSGHELPVVLGYADAHGEWLRNGNRHHAAQEVAR